MSGSEIVISFHNLSETNFSEYTPQSGSNIQKGSGHLVVQPANTMAAGSSQNFEVTFDLSWLQSGFTSIQWSWSDGVNVFGIKIYTQYQLVGIGGAPIWYYLYGAASDNPSNWIEGGKSPYTFPQSVGYNIVATPSSQHQALTVTVGISNIMPPATA